MKKITVYTGPLCNYCDAAKLLKLEKPNSVKLEELESEMLQNFYKESKKVDNKKMKAFFKYDLKYPTYKEGLNYIFNNGL